MVAVNNKEIIVNCITCLIEVGVNEIIIISGYQEVILTEFIKNRFKSEINVSITFIHNTQYADSGNFYSLSLAKNFLNSDLLLLDADVFMNKNIFTKLLDVKKGNVAAVAPYQSYMTGNVVIADQFDRVVSFCDSQKNDLSFADKEYWKTANVYLIEQNFIEQVLISHINNENKYKHYDDVILQSSINDVYPLYVAKCNVSEWVEIDDLNDLAIAEYHFYNQTSKYDTLCNLHGSYWKYGFTDHCLLYNLYFPPKDFFAILQNSIVDLVKYYPSTRAYPTKLLSTYLNIAEEHLVVVNGSSELIKIIINSLAEKIVVPVPSFNEYESVSHPEKLIKYSLPHDDFDINVDEFIELIINSKANYALIINPNNPTSTSTSKNKILKILNGIKNTDCMLIVDESFIDFANDPDQISMIKEIEAWPNLIIIKSISKAYGVGGIRLGYLISSNQKFLTTINKYIPIWNLNSFAELFIYLLPRYHQEFIDSCKQVREDRDKMYKELLTIPNLKVYYPQANFIFCKLPPETKDARLISKALFDKHNIFIKDCSGKSMPDANRYIRLSCRTPKENSELINCLKKVMAD